MRKASNIIFMFLVVLIFIPAGNLEAEDSQQPILTKPPIIKYNDVVLPDSTDFVKVNWETSTGETIQSFEFTAQLTSSIISFPPEVLAVTYYNIPDNSSVPQDIRFSYYGISAGNYTWGITLNKEGYQSQVISLEIEVIKTTIKSYSINMYSPILIEGKPLTINFFVSVEYEEIIGTYSLNQVVQLRIIIALNYENGNIGLTRYSTFSNEFGPAQITLDENQTLGLIGIDSIQVEVLSLGGETLLNTDLDGSDLILTNQKRVIPNIRTIPLASAPLKPNGQKELIIFGVTLIILLLLISSIVFISRLTKDAQSISKIPDDPWPKDKV